MLGNAAGGSMKGEPKIVPGSRAVRLEGWLWSLGQLSKCLRWDRNGWGVYLHVYLHVYPHDSCICINTKPQNVDWHSWRRLQLNAPLRASLPSRVLAIVC